MWEATTSFLQLLRQGAGTQRWGPGVLSPCPRSACPPLPLPRASQTLGEPTGGGGEPATARGQLPGDAVHLLWVYCVPQGCQQTLHGQLSRPAQTVSAKLFVI